MWGGIVVDKERNHNKNGFLLDLATCALVTKKSLDAVRVRRIYTIYVHILKIVELSPIMAVTKAKLLSQRLLTSPKKCKQYSP